MVVFRMKNNVVCCFFILLVQVIQLGFFLIELLSLQQNIKVSSIFFFPPFFFCVVFKIDDFILFYLKTACLWL